MPATTGNLAPFRSAAAAHLWERHLPRVIIGLLAALLVLAQTGCEGCRPRFLTSRDKRQDEAKKAGSEEKEEKPLAPYESPEGLRVLPLDDMPATRTAVKPGHWMSLQQQLKSNRQDFFGELHCFSTRADGELFQVRQTPYRLITQRPVTLPKGQGKEFDLLLFTPTASTRLGQMTLTSQLRPLSGGMPIFTQSEAANRLAPYQYMLVVLSRLTDNYQYLKTLPTIRRPVDEMWFAGSSPDYLVVLPPELDRPMLPTHPLTWTTIAALVIDDYPLERLSSVQQQGLVDWLHWGGQLIVSGPNSLDALHTSFLASYLPAQGTGTYRLSPQDLEELNQTWSLTPQDATAEDQLTINDQTPLEAVQLQLADGAQFVAGSGQLVAERRVGRGRVILTAFSLSARAVVNWPALDNFYNGCLLRRPPRRFEFNPTQGPLVHWTGDLARIRSHAGYNQPTAEMEDELTMADEPPSRLPSESLLNSKIRFFSRDATAEADGFELDRQLQLGINGYGFDTQSGTAGWNDFSASSRIARQILNEAAGVEVPEAEFVLWTLAAYLLVLVPGNWLLFRLLGRIEWAWAAVPVIAVAGTFLVVHLARLDIGFARSRTELVIVETQPDYARAHVTRYLGLYSSLSTDYALSFRDPSSLVQPFATDQSDRNTPFESQRNVQLRRGERTEEPVRLEGFRVASNTTGMLHCEQFYEMPGPVRLVSGEGAEDRLQNGSEWTFQDVLVLTRRSGQLLHAILPELPSGSTVELKFSPATASLSSSSHYSPPPEGEPDLSRLLQLAQHTDRVYEGDVRLVGWAAQPLPGLSIEPSANQNLTRTVLVAHLRYGALPAPQSDHNTSDAARRPRSSDPSAPDLPAVGNQP